MTLPQVLEYMRQYSYQKPTVSSELCTMVDQDLQSLEYWFVSCDRGIDPQQTRDQMLIRAMAANDWMITGYTDMEGIRWKRTLTGDWARDWGDDD